MKKLSFPLILVTFATFMVGCAKAEMTSNSDTNISKDNTPTPAVTQNIATPTPVIDTSDSASANEKGTVEEVNFTSKAIAKNAVGLSADKTIYIYLPPSYNTESKSYPVVYFLHGYADSPKAFMTTFASKFDEQFTGSDKEFILVALDGNTIAGGSFYVNSKASGYWEDYVTQELVSYMDENYRTIATADSRGISGYSMGGFGALYLSLRHPDIFCSTLVFCPGIFADNDLEAVLDTWSGATDVKRTYAQAFSPNLKDTKNYGNIIKDSDIKAKNQVWKDWMNGYGNWDQKIKDYLNLKQPLKSIMINYSDNDSYDWIPRGCEDMIDQLKENGIDHSSDTFIGGHIVPYDAVELYFVPFFNKNLNYK